MKCLCSETLFRKGRKKFVLQRIFDVTAMFFDDVGSFLETAQKQRFEEMEKEVRRQKQDIQIVVIERKKHDGIAFRLCRLAET